jgi:hypothetical protein
MVYEPFLVILHVLACNAWMLHKAFENGRPVGAALCVVHLHHIINALAAQKAVTEYQVGVQRWYYGSMQPHENRRICLFELSA